MIDLLILANVSSLAIGMHLEAWSTKRDARAAIIERRLSSWPGKPS